jgi:AhpD family alkylhydroperoxidase
MDERTKELIAIGAAAAVNCQSCFDNHLTQCARLGISRDEVNAAAETGMMVARGAASKIRTHISTALGAQTSPKESSGGGCC